MGPDWRHDATPEARVSNVTYFRNEKGNFECPDSSHITGRSIRLEVPSTVVKFYVILLAFLRQYREICLTSTDIRQTLPP